MITVRLIGGIGNQLFQYALARRLAAENSMPVALDAVYGFINSKYHNRYMLDQFGASPDIRLDGKVPLAMKCPHILRDAALRHDRQRPLSRRKYFAERYDEPLREEQLRLNAPLYFFGFWQTWRFMEPIASELRAELRSKTSATPGWMQLEKAIQSCCSVAVHVRCQHGMSRGKVITPFMHEQWNLPAAYYERAMNIIIQQLPQAHFFIFSDSPDWCRANLRFPAPATFVADCAGLSDVDELQLMARCQHHIVSISTYSWWGAWLAGQPDGLVVRPPLHMPIKYGSAQYYPPHWKELER